MHLVPRVLANLLNGYTVLRICDEDASDHVLSLRTQKLRQGIISVQDFTIEIGSLLVFIWQVAAEHGVKDDATRPQV